MFRSVVSAIRILTIVPVPGRDCENIRRASLLFPLVGLALGGLVAAYAWILGQLGNPDWMIASVIGVAAITWLTGALHLDGLGDVADAFGGGRSREKILEILKDCGMGVFGVTAIVLDLSLKVACWRHHLETGHVSVILFSLVLSRSVQAVLLAFLPPARKEGTAAAFSGAGIGHKLGVVIILLVIVGTFAFLEPRRTAAATVFSLAAVTIFGVWTMKKIGGITGDCVGAGSELTELAVLVGGLV